MAATFLAIGVVFFTPSLGWSTVLEDRVDPTTVKALYEGQPVPTVVQATLDQLAEQSFPRTETAINQSQTGGPLSFLTSKAQPVQLEPAIAGPYPVIALCARSHEIVETLFPSACNFASFFTIDVFDRALIYFDEVANQPLSPDELRQAALRFSQSVFVRATLTISNSGRAAAENIAITPPDGYSARGDTSQFELDAGASATRVFETTPGTSHGVSAVALNNPSFDVHSDPTGPIAPFIWTVVVGILLVWCVGVAWYGLTTTPL